LGQGAGSKAQGARSLWQGDRRREKGDRRRETGEGRPENGELSENSWIFGESEDSYWHIQYTVGVILM